MNQSELVLHDKSTHLRYSMLRFAPLALLALNKKAKGMQELVKLWNCVKFCEKSL